MFESPTYIVLNVPAAAAETVKKLRHRFDPLRAEQTVEICLAGSGGVGCVAPEQPPGQVFSAIDRIAAATAPFFASFSRICRFKNTGIYYLALSPTAPFVALHQTVAGSGIIFLPCAWPYSPHCTLKLRGAMTEEDEQALLAVRPPSESFIINTISVYELDASSGGILRHRCNLTGQSRELSG